MSPTRINDWITAEHYGRGKETDILRYRFHSADGSRDPDTEGTELADDQAAQQAAVAFAGQVLKDQPMLFWEKGTWRVEMTDDAGILLFTVITLAIDAPRPERLPRTSMKDA